MRSVGKAQAQAGGCGGGLGRGRRVYLYGHGAGERERARQVRALAELERYVKGQALGGELAGGAALGGFFRGVPEPAVGGRVGQLRGEQLEAGAGGVGVFIGGVDDELWELIHAGYTAGMGYGAAGAGAGAQREPVGAGLDKARAVSGVLDRVGKDEGLFLRRVEFVHAEEVAHRHREQRGDPRAHEADRVLFPARGAAVFLGQLRGLVGGVELSVAAAGSNQCTRASPLSPSTAPLATSLVASMSGRFRPASRTLTRRIADGESS